MPGIEKKGRSKIANYRHGGRAGFSRGGGSAPFLRGQSGSSNLKSPRGYEGMKRILEADKKILKHKVKVIKKTPDKTFKYNNPETKTYTNPRSGKEVTVQKQGPVKGSIGKKKYIQDVKRYHHANKPKVK